MTLFIIKSMTLLHRLSFLNICKFHFFFLNDVNRRLLLWCILPVFCNRLVTDDMCAGEETILHWNADFQDKVEWCSWERQMLGRSVSKIGWAEKPLVYIFSASTKINHNNTNFKQITIHAFSRKKGRSQDRSEEPQMPN